MIASLALPYWSVATCPIISAGACMSLALGKLTTSILWTFTISSSYSVYTIPVCNMPACIGYTCLCSRSYYMAVKIMALLYIVDVFLQTCISKKCCETNYVMTYDMSCSVTSSFKICWFKILMKNNCFPVLDITLLPTGQWRRKLSTTRGGGTQ